MQAYNAQIAVDEAHQVIVAAALSNQGTDAQYFEPMLRRVVDNCDAVPELTTGDAGYFSADNVLAAERMGTEPLLSVAGHYSDGGLVEARADLSHLQTAPRVDARAASHITRPSCLRSTQSDRRACLRPDPLVSRLSAAVLAWPLQSQV